MHLLQDQTRLRMVFAQPAGFGAQAAQALSEFAPKCIKTQKNWIFAQMLMSHFEDYNRSGDSVRVLMMIII